MFDWYPGNFTKTKLWSFSIVSKKLYSHTCSLQVAAQLLSVGMIINAHIIRPNSVSSVLLQPWFVMLVIALAIERLSGLALGVAMERDWVVLVSFFFYPNLESPFYYFSQFVMFNVISVSRNR